MLASRTFLLSAYPFPRDHTPDEPEILPLAWTRDLSGKFVISRLADQPSPRRNDRRGVPKFDFQFRYARRHLRGMLLDDTR